MIATDHFVYIHQPKTGGTFVRKVLFELSDLLGTYQPTVRTRRAFTRVKLKHGTCRDIPRRLRALPIWSTVRNPFDHYVSEYEFGWWRRDEFPRYFHKRFRDFDERYPSYPDLAFADFLRLYHEAFGRNPASRQFESEDGVGWLTERFVEYYAKAPRRLFKRLSPRDPVETLEAALYDVRFLKMEALNDEVHDALLDADVPEEEARFVREWGRILPDHAEARERERDWRSYYTPGLIDQVLHNDRLLFSLFPEYAP